MNKIIQYASDLHIEFPYNKKFLMQNPLRSVGDILVLGGDIVPIAIMDKHQDFFNYLADNFEQTYWIPGNHEYYHYDIVEKSGVLNENIRSNVSLVNNISVDYKNVRLIFSTLWTKISQAHQWKIEKSLNDFHLIKYKGFRLTAEKYNQFFDDNLSFIQNELTKVKVEKVAVFTHHCPTFMNYPEQYKGSELNEAFASQSLAIVRKLGIDTSILNVNGGAIALGHPLGCSGAKLSVQLFNELRRRNQKYGMVTACVGGGQGVAGIYEMLN